MNTKYSFTISDQIFFAQRLSLLLDSNISLTESLSIIRSMDISKTRKKIYEKIIADCEQGISLSKSLLNSKVSFDSLLITLIKNGEYSGSLVMTLSQIAQNLEKRNELKKKMISTLIYPSFIFCATIGMALFLVLYIFPKIVPLLGSLNIELPLLTRMVKGLYEYSVFYGLETLGIILFLFIICIFLIKKVASIRKLFHKVLLTFPILGSYIKMNTLGTLCGIGEMLLSSGRSLSEFHLFSVSSSKNLLFQYAFETIYTQSIQGISFSQSMEAYPKLFSRTIIDMCSIGERTGNLPIMLGHCSRIFEQDIDLFLKRFSSLIEPLLMIFMGVLVGAIALSIILPVYEITNHLTH